MAGLLKVSDAATIGMHAMIVLAAHPKALHTTRQIATTLNVSEAHLAKVFQRLAHSGLVGSTRGPKGGFSLSRTPGKIRMLEVYEAIEGPMTTSDCLLPKQICTGENCILGSLVKDVDARFRKQLRETKLSQALRLLPASEEV